MAEESNGVENNHLPVAPPQPVGVVKDYDVRRRVLALTIVPMLFLASFLTIFPAVLAFGLNIPIVPALLATIVAEILVVAFVVWYGNLRPIKDFLYLRVYKWWHLIVGLGAGLLGYVILQAGAIGITSLTGQEIASSDTSAQLGALSGVQAVFILIGLVAILGPFIEELLFRGVIIGSLQNSKWNKPWIAIIVSGVTFGIMHFQGFATATDAFVLGWTMVMGFGFALLMLKTKSLWTAVAAHVAYNMVTALLLLSGFEG